MSGEAVKWRWNGGLLAQFYIWVQRTLSSPGMQDYCLILVRIIHVYTMFIRFFNESSVCT